MGQQLYFDNFMPAADIVILAVCLVIGVLFATSYTVKTARFGLFINMLIYLFLAAASDMMLHDYYTRITDGNYTPIYVIRVVYHGFLFLTFLLYVVYLVELLLLDKKTRKPIMRVAIGIFIFVFITDIILSFTGHGFRLSPDGTPTPGINMFMIGYVLFVADIIYIMLRYRNRIYNKALFGMLGTIGISFIILFMQERHLQSSFTVSSFLFPTIALLYLFHSSPYDIETGSVSISAFKDSVRYYHSKGWDFYFISMYLPSFDSEGKALPENLQALLRQFPAEHFKKTVLYKISYGQMLLMMPARSNPDFDLQVKEAISAFKKEYDKLHADFKVVIGKSIGEISRRNEYLSFIKDIHRNMEINSFHRVDEKDVTTFNRSEDILKELEDIFKKHDLNDDRIIPYCQPVYNIKNGKYDTAEALMRLNLPGLGMVFPDQFIPLAEEHGYIHILTKIILHKTCECIKNLLSEGYEVKRISVNVSMPELRDETFTADIEKIIGSSSIPTGKVAIEITESQSDSDYLNVKDMIEKLKGTGIKFYLDDFGTGYSNIERIMKLPFDIIKFDRSLVLASQSDERSKKIVGRLAGMFSDLHYSVLYEGVEDENDEKRCISMSASYLQGYKYSKPIPMDELRNFFSKPA